MEEQMNKKRECFETSFKEFYSERRHIPGLFRLIFTPDEFAVFNWKTVKVEKCPPIRKERQGGKMLFSVKLNHQESKAMLLLLFEHTNDLNSEFTQRALNYKIAVYRKWKWRRPVIPILLFNSLEEKIWKNALDFHTPMRNLAPKLLDKFDRHILQFHCKLLNMQQLDFDIIE